MDKLRVLIADDHDLVRSTLAVFLRSLGGIDVVAEAINGSAAVDSALATHPDLVVMDGSMPVMSGYEAARSIKAAMPETQVAIVSVSHGAMYEQHAANCHADAFIPKGSLKRTLRMIVEQLRARKKSVLGAAA